MPWDAFISPAPLFRAAPGVPHPATPVQYHGGDAGNISASAASTSANPSRAPKCQAGSSAAVVITTAATGKYPVASTTTPPSAMHAPHQSGENKKQKCAGGRHAFSTAKSPTPKPENYGPAWHPGPPTDKPAVPIAETASHTASRLLRFSKGLPPVPEAPMISPSAG